MPTLHPIRSAIPAKGVRPLKEMQLRVDAANQCKVQFRGIKINFSVNPENLSYSALRDGRLGLVIFSDRLELWKRTVNGKPQVIDGVKIDVDGFLMREGRRIVDAKGAVRLGISGARRYVSADTVFCEYATVRRSSYFNPSCLKATLVYGNIRFVLPIDRRFSYGEAAREGRIVALANHRRIDFFEAVVGEDEYYIDSIEIDDEGFLLRAGKRVEHRGRTVSINSRREESMEISVNHFIDAFCQEKEPADVQVSISASTGRAVVTHRNVDFVFSVDKDKMYYQDILAGNLYVRFSLPGSIQVVRKALVGGEVRESLIGEMEISQNNVITFGKGKRIELDAKKRGYLRVDEAIDALSGREVVVPGGRHQVYVDAFGIRFIFPMQDGYYYKPPLLGGRVVCRIYRTKILFGIKEKNFFFEIGRVTFNNKNQLLVDGQRYKHAGEIVQKMDSRKPRLKMRYLIPEFGRIEKTVPPSFGSIKQWGIRFKFDVDEASAYFGDFGAGRFVARFVGKRAEVYVAREDGQVEYLGAFSLDDNGFLLGDNGEIYRSKSGPVKWGQGKPAFVSRLISILRRYEDRDLDIEKVFSPVDYKALGQIFQGEDYKAWLKRGIWFARRFMAFPPEQTADSLRVMVPKIFFALNKALRRLESDFDISPDLKVALARETLDCMADMFEHDDFRVIVGAMRTQYLIALRSLARIELVDSSQLRQSLLQAGL